MTNNMVGLSRHIAVLLLGVFLFPVVFQAIHITWHQVHDDHITHHFCHADLIVQHSQPDEEILSEKENYCPVCEYKFSINDLPKISVYRTVIPVIVGSVRETQIQLLFQSVILIKSPRAPPALS
jgi:hypothetical protein